MFGFYDVILYKRFITYGPDFTMYLLFNQTNTALTVDEVSVPISPGVTFKLLSQQGKL